MRMKLKLIGAAVGAVVLCLVVAALLASHHANPPKVSNEQPESGLQNETQLRDFKHEVTVYVTPSGPTPQTLNVPPDTRINWENKDSSPHKIAITPGTPVPPLFDDSHLLDLGGGYPYVIHQPATFHYYIVDRPTQGGTVIVK